QFGLRSPSSAPPRPEGARCRFAGPPAGSPRSPPRAPWASRRRNKTPPRWRGGPRPTGESPPGYGAVSWEGLRPGRRRLARGHRREPDEIAGDPELQDVAVGNGLPLGRRQVDIADAPRLSQRDHEARNRRIGERVAFQRHVAR